MLILSKLLKLYGEASRFWVRMVTVNQKVASDSNQTEWPNCTVRCRSFRQVAFFFLVHVWSSCQSVCLSAAGFPFAIPCFRLWSNTFQMILKIPLLFPFMIVIIARPLHPCSHSSWENVTLDWNYRRENSCSLHSTSVWDINPLRAYAFFPVIKLIFSLIVCRQITDLLKANKSYTSCVSRQPENLCTAHTHFCDSRILKLLHFH